MNINSEREGFEPPLDLTKSVFKTGAINRSATFPPSKYKEGLGRTGFEPVKALPTDLQSVPFNRSGTDPKWGWGKRDLNPHDFKNQRILSP